MKDQKGQIILLLILVMTVALAIGLSVIQRSLSDISTASKVEQSSRAYSAAEAGIEKALGTGSTAPFSLPNNSQVTATDTGLIPAVPSSGQQDPFEFPPLAKEETAHVWLADLNDSTHNPPAQFYRQSSINVYWGDAAAAIKGDKSALELTVVYYDPSSTTYKNSKIFLESDTGRVASNSFTDNSANCTNSIPLIYADGSSSPYTYACQRNISFASLQPPIPVNAQLMLIRARLLYNSTFQPFAVQAITCPVGTADCRDYSIPPQARSLTAIGTSGTTQRKVKLFQVQKVVPPYFDYAIFSSGAISK
ncbi:MAG: pilus assembly PilX N-terminal domain-containing protein [Patescibacteria group bacterium]|nr:pilus assembly PilX N-terminal domain-containing protein [Patescibacteria group bacterium]